MPKIAADTLKQKRAFVAGLDNEFSQWRPHYIKLAQKILPRRYQWLQQTTAIASATEHVSMPVTSSNTSKNTQQMNAEIYDSTGTEAARTLTHGLINGHASPARPWFKLRLAGFTDEEDYPIEYLRWLDDCRDRMLTVMAESNFYGALAVMYADLVIFGIGATLIYDDDTEVIRCYHSPVGQFRFYQDDRQMIQGMSRVFRMQVHQLVERFGLENCSRDVQTAFKRGGKDLLREVTVYHLVEPNKQDALHISPQFRHRELYWEAGVDTGEILSLNGFREDPKMAMRWEVNGNDVYAHSPGMDALPDILQLQHETLRKAQALDKLVRPPLAVDVALKSQPDSLLPGGVAWLPSSSQVGAKPIYTVQPPLGEMTADIGQIQQRIRRIFYNHLFRNVSDLETVRSATEIDARKSEDMVILGAVMDRTNDEGYDPGIRRIFNIMERRGMFLEPPLGLEDEKIEIQYVSILADAQRSVGTATVERAYQMVGELSGLVPDVLDIPDWDEGIREYFAMLGVSAKTLKSRDRVASDRQARQEQLEAQQAALVGKELTDAAKNLSETEIGSGGTALDAML